MLNRFKAFSFCLLLSTNYVFADSNHIQIAVASNFKTTLEALVEAYPNKNVTISLSSASTGVLYAQIKHGAPFDVFFSANTTTPEALKQEMTLSEPFIYAQGQVVFWCPKGAPQTEESFMQWHGQYSLANPRLAPYGAAAQDIVNAVHWTDANRAVTAANIAQATQYVVTGNVDCGFVAASLLPKGTPEKQIYRLTPQWHTAIPQSAIVLERGAAKAELTEFLDYLESELSQKLLIANGYVLPSSQTMATKDD